MSGVSHSRDVVEVHDPGMLQLIDREVRIAWCAVSRARNSTNTPSTNRISTESVGQGVIPRIAAMDIMSPL